jgi:hypothetical protein
MLVSPIPAGLVLDYSPCRKDCVNPAHHTPITVRQCVLGPNSIQGKNARKTHCLHGHALVAGNLSADALKRGERICMTCARQWDRNYKNKIKVKANAR